MGAPGECLVGNGAPAEERDRAFVGSAEPLRVEAAERRIGVGVGERSVHDQTEGLVSSRKRERERLVREETVEDDHVGAAASQIEQNGALAEQRVGVTLHDCMYSGVVRGYRTDSRGDL